MKKWMMIAALMMLPSMTQAQPMHDIDLGALECNWGILTMQAFLFDEFPIGEHSRDPAGDGFGKDDDTPSDGRVGLANFGDLGIEGLCSVICDGLASDPDSELVCPE